MDSNGPGSSPTLGRPALLAVAAAGVLLLMSLAPTIAASGPLRPVQASGCAVGEACPSESATDTASASASSSEAPSESASEAPSASDTGCWDVTGKPVPCPSGSAVPTETAPPTESTPPSESTPPTGSAEASSSAGVTPPATTTGNTPGGSGSALALALVVLSLGAGGLVLFGTRTGVRRRR